MVIMHHQQLTWLMALTEELVKTIEGLQIPAATTLPLVPPTTPPVQVPNIVAANPITSTLYLVLPEQFEGTAPKCKGLLMQCAMFVNQQTVLYPTEKSRTLFVCSLLTGRALD